MPGIDQSLVRLRTTRRPGSGIAGEGVPLVGHGVHERLVDHDDATRPHESAQRLLGVQDAGRVGGVADHDEVGVVGDLRRVEDEPVRGVGEDVLGLVAGGGEGDVRLGELRVHDDGVDARLEPGR